MRMVALGVIHSPDLRTVLQRFTEFSALVPGCPRFGTEMTADATRVSVDVAEVDDPVHLVTDLLVVVAHRLPGWMIGTRIPLRSVELPYERPAEIADYGAVFGRLPTFSAGAAAITFDSALLDSPVIRDEAELLSYVRRSPSDLFAVRDYGSTTADRVRKILEQGLRGTWPGPEEIAARLAISAQHLRRLLREEGTSATQVKEDILRDAAIESLAQGKESVDDLAARLGFSEASAFRRAFRRWTGSPPGAYRMAGDESAPVP
jgi:AraC-like DNA-binding protein